MAVSNVVSAVTRIGDGIAVAFAFDIEAVSAASIKVGYIVGITVVEAAPATYSVVMNGALTGGTVTFLVPPAAATKIYIYRVTDQTQVVSVSRQQAYNPSVVERVWDKLTLLIQELSTEVRRSVKAVPGVNPDLLVNALETARQEAVASAAAAAAATTQTAADRVQTGLDRTTTTANAATTTADKAATAADKAATAADRVVTTADRVQTQADRVQTGLNSAATAADRVQTGLDRVATAADRVQTGLDRVQTGLDRVAAAASAAEAALYVPTVASQAEAGAGTDNIKLMTPLRVKEALNASGNAPTYACRAWVNFNGTGTVAIRASGNVSSITDNGPGDYTVNFATDMPDVNYAVVCSGKFDDTTAGNNIVFTPYSYTTGSVRINANNSAGAKADCIHVNVAVFR